MKFLDATLKPPTWTQVGVAFLWSVFLAFLLALLIAPAIDLLVDLAFAGASPGHRSERDRFFFFLFLNFILGIVQATGVSLEKTPKAYWFSFWAIAIFIIFHG